MTRWRSELTCVCLLAGFGLAAWGFLLSLPLTSPDTWPIMVQGSRLFEDPASVLSEKYLAGLWEGASFYRPVLTVFTALEWRLFGESPLPWHLLRLLVLLACCWTAGRLAARASPAAVTSWLVAALFILLHPIQGETVPAVERVGDTLLGLATLLALLLLVRARESTGLLRFALGVGIALLAPGIKDSGLLVPVLAVLVLEPWRRADPRARSALRASLVLLAGLGAHMLLRFAILGHLGRYDRVFRSLTPLEALGELLRGLWVPSVAPWAGGFALILLGIALLLLPSLLREDRLGFSAESRRIFLCSSAWIVVATLAMIRSPRFYARYAEGILPPVALLLALFTGGMVSLAMRSSGLQRVKATAASLALIAAGCCVVLPGSQLFWSLPQWKEAGETADRVIRLSRELAEESRRNHEVATARSGPYALQVLAGGSERDTLRVLVEPFPWLPGRAVGPGLVAETESAMVLMPYALRAALMLDGWKEVQVTAGGQSTPFRSRQSSAPR